MEAIFGQLKCNNKFNRFIKRGLDKVDIEFALMAIAHNLRKWVKRRNNTSVKASFNNKMGWKNINTNIVAKIYSELKNVA